MIHFIRAYILRFWSLGQKPSLAFSLTLWASKQRACWAFLFHCPATASSPWLSWRVFSEPKKTTAGEHPDPVDVGELAQVAARLDFGGILRTAPGAGARGISEGLGEVSSPCSAGENGGGGRGAAPRVVVVDSFRGAGR